MIADLLGPLRQLRDDVRDAVDDYRDQYADAVDDLRQLQTFAQLTASPPAIPLDKLEAPAAGPQTMVDADGVVWRWVAPGVWAR